MGTIFSLGAMGIFLWAGIGLARRVLHCGGAEQLALGCSFGLALLAALPGLAAFLFGFTLPAALTGLAAAAVIGFFAWHHAPVPESGQGGKAFWLCVLPLWLLSLYLLHTDRKSVV